MFLDFFLDLKKVKIPVSLNEYFNFLEALKQGLSLFDLNSFYYLARSSLIKDEKLIDRFDLVFSKYFNGLDDIQPGGGTRPRGGGWHYWKMWGGKPYTSSPYTGGTGGGGSNYNWNGYTGYDYDFAIYIK